MEDSFEELDSYVEPQFEAEDVLIEIELKVKQDGKTNAVKRSVDTLVDECEPGGFGLKDLLSFQLSDAVTSLLGCRRQAMLVLAKALSAVEDSIIDDDSGPPGTSLDCEVLWLEAMNELGVSAQLAGRKLLEEREEWRDSLPKHPDYAESVVRETNVRMEEGELVKEEVRVAVPGGSER